MNMECEDQSGKIDNCMMAMERLQIDVLGLEEVRWSQLGITDKGKYMIVFSGGENNQHGMAL